MLKVVASPERRVLIVDENNEIVAAMNTQLKGWEHAAQVALEFAAAVNERMATA